MEMFVIMNQALTFDLFPKCGATGKTQFYLSLKLQPGVVAKQSRNVV